MWSKIWNLPLFRVLLWREYICDMEKDKCIILLKKKMTILKEKYGITSLVLFGSTARGEETEKSDIDLFVETQTANPFLLQDAKEFLEKEMGIPVDIVRDHENLNPKLRKRILKDGIAIF
jgi:predicted nucleotidyltransferase